MQYKVFLPNTAIFLASKRLMKEFDEANRMNDLMVHLTSDNLLSWHFTFEGPKDSVFESEIYHGQINFPQNYPFSPPDIIMLTPNHRFETNTKICLTNTSYHPELWNPTWVPSAIIIALRSMFDDGQYSRRDVRSRSPSVPDSNKFQCCECGHIRKMWEEKKKAIKGLPLD